MQLSMQRPSHPSPRVATANDRFKRGFGTWFWGGLTAATALHAVVFLASPTFELHAMGPDRSPMEVLGTPEVELPPPPADVLRPATPVVAAGVEADDPTIPPTTLDRYPPALLAPPADGGEGDPADPVFTPMTIRPALENPAEIASALRRFYPPALREAGIGGTVLVWFFIDADGRVQETRVRESSGFAAFDDAALEVARQMRFSPAWNRDRRVAVWVSIPISFEVRR